MSSDQYKRVDQLLRKYQEKTISYEEYLELFEYIGNKDYKRTILDIMDQQHKTLNPDADVHDIDWNSIYKQITQEQGYTKNSFWKPLRYLAAAIALIAVSYGIGKFYSNKNVVSDIVAVNDVLPGSDKATLTLSDGSQITLSEKNKGELAREGGSKVNQVANGSIIYNQQKETELGQSVVYNTLTTPRGGKYQVTLSDGSKVWLNAESSLTFPASFAGKQRKVILKGEGYFEVAKNKEMPFIVEVGDANIQVLGTHFNIMAYQDEEILKTTLLEGSINFKRGRQTQMLVPGQQARYTTGTEGFSVIKADVEEALAWKNNLFVFNNTGIDDIVKSVQRWYNVDVVYDGDKPQVYYTGVIPRSANLSKVLKVLESAGNIKFAINGNTVVCSKKI